MRKNEICSYKMNSINGGHRNNILCTNSNANERKDITELCDMTNFIAITECAGITSEYIEPKVILTHAHTNTNERNDEEKYEYVEFKHKVFATGFVEPLPVQLSRMTTTFPNYHCSRSFHIFFFSFHSRRNVWWKISMN